MQVVVGSESTSIGTLDIPSRSYHTFLRSHSKTILAISGIKTGDTSDGKTEIATASEDKTVRVWCARFPKVDQLVEFSFGADVPLCLAAHPRERVLAVGFSSGTMRVLGMQQQQQQQKRKASNKLIDIQTTSSIHEVRQHQGPILSIAYSSDGSRLFTLSHDSALVVYDILASCLDFTTLVLFTILLFFFVFLLFLLLLLSFDKFIDCTGKYLPIHVIPTQNRLPSSCQLATSFEEESECIAYLFFLFPCSGSTCSFF